MVDFKRFNEELDAAGYDLHKVEKSTSEPATGLKLLLQTKGQLYSPSAKAKHLLDAHIAASKAIIKRGVGLCRPLSFDKIAPAGGGGNTIYG